MVISSCSDDESNIIKQNPDENDTHIKISPSKIKIGEIGDTIRITGTGLSKIKRIVMEYEGLTDDFDGSFEFGLSGAPYIKYTDEEILVKPDYFPEYYREKISIYLKEADNTVIMKSQLDVYGLIPVKKTFSNATQIEVVSSLVAYVLDENRVIYKSSDGYIEWNEFFSSEYHIRGMQFMNASTGWIVVREGMYSNFYITKDGGASFELYFPKDSITHDVIDFQFTSIDKGYFRTIRDEMFVIDALEVVPFYDFFNELDTSVLESEKVALFRAIDNDLIFIQPLNSESLIRISDGEILETPMGEFYWNMPEIFGNIGYFAPFGKKLYKTTNKGLSWVEIREFENFYLNAGFLNKDLGFAINSDYTNPTDIYFTDDGGESWNKYYTSAGRFDAGRLFDFTFNSGLLGGPRRLFRYVPY